MKAVVLVLVALLCFTQVGALTIDAYMDPYYNLTATVQNQAGAPVDNFGNPSAVTSGPGFQFYQYADATYVYGFFETFGAVSSNIFATVYYNTRPTTQSADGINIAFNITPTSISLFVSNYTLSTLAGSPQQASRSDANTTFLEYAIPIQYFSQSSFVSDSGFNVSYLNANGNTVQVTIVQAFSRTVVGGSSFGPSRLGQALLTSFSPAPSNSAASASASGVAASASASGVAASASSAPAAQFETQAQIANDNKVLQYALTLEHLEANFYSTALSRFSSADFVAAGFSSSAYNYVSLIAFHEAAHVQLLQQVLQSRGASPVPACTYNFNASLANVATFIATAAVLEETGVSAYDGAANGLIDAGLLQAAATIATTEARHAAYLNLLNQSNPFPNSFDTALSPQSVIIAAANFFVSCPYTFDLPVIAYTVAPFIANATYFNRSGQLETQAQIDNDNKVLNYSLFLELFGHAFYSQASALYDAAAFQAAGFNSSVYNNFMAIVAHENAHLAFLNSTLASRGGSLAQPCTYNLGNALSSVSAVLNFARILENLEVTAYDGAINRLTDYSLVQGAATIATVEARHADYLNNIILGEGVQNATVDTANTPEQILNITAEFFGSDCVAPPVPQLAYLFAANAANAVDAPSNAPASASASAVSASASAVSASASAVSASASAVSASASTAPSSLAPSPSASSSTVASASTAPSSVAPSPSVAASSTAVSPSTSINPSQSQSFSASPVPSTGGGGGNQGASLSASLSRSASLSASLSRSASLSASASSCPGTTPSPSGCGCSGNNDKDDNDVTINFYFADILRGNYNQRR